MKNVLPTTLILSSLALLAFAFLVPTPSSNQLAAVASSPSITFKQSSLSVTEGDRLKVTIVAPSPVTATTRVKVTTKSGTAKTGTDFTPVNTTVTFYKGGLKEKTITLSTKSDSVQEEPETLSLSLSINNRVANTATVTVNNKGTTGTQGTTGTPGSTLPATANQGNTLGGNPSFTTYSPQGLPQPMNPKCKQVPSKYTFEQIKFPPNNPSNPFYTWEDVYGIAFPYTRESDHYLSFRIQRYNSIQFQVPPTNSPIFRKGSYVANVGHYPHGSVADFLTFVSECPWQDYYQDIIDFETFVSPVAKEFSDALGTQGNQILNQQTFLQGDLYKRWKAEEKRIKDLAGASGFCHRLIKSHLEDSWIRFTEDESFFKTSPLDPSYDISPHCFVKPGGTYYVTSIDARIPGQQIGSDGEPYYDGVQGFGVRSEYTGHFMEFLNQSPFIATDGPFSTHPDISKYGFVELRNIMGQIQSGKSLPLAPRKLCRLGDAVRTDCWMGAFGISITPESNKTRVRVGTYKWSEISTERPDMFRGGPGRTYVNPRDTYLKDAPTCPSGISTGAMCNTTEKFYTYCIMGEFDSRRCDPVSQFQGRYGPNEPD